MHEIFSAFHPALFNIAIFNILCGYLPAFNIHNLQLTQPPVHLLVFFPNTDFHIQIKAKFSPFFILMAYMIIPFAKGLNLFMSLQISTLHLQFSRGVKSHLSVYQWIYLYFLFYFVNDIPYVCLITALQEMDNQWEWETEGTIPHNKYYLKGGSDLLTVWEMENTVSQAVDAYDPFADYECKVSTNFFA